MNWWVVYIIFYITIGFLFCAIFFKYNTIKKNRLLLFITTTLLWPLLIMHVLMYDDPEKHDGS